MDKREQIKAAILDTAKNAITDDEAREVVASPGVAVRTHVRAGEPFVKIEFVKAVPFHKLIKI